jgi:SAM-dependent methyltransferase
VDPDELGREAKRAQGDSQTRVFEESESFRYFTARAGFDIPTLKSEDLVALPEQVDSVLDVGCGTAVNLAHVADLLSARLAVGVEPNPQTVEALRINHRDDSRLSFYTASAHRLPFETSSFDVVICWSVLHWVGRDNYLQALGELVRVSKSWLLVMDFVGAEAFRVPYHHYDGVYTYKMDFTEPLMSSGVLNLVDERRWWEPEAGGPRVPLTSADLQPFRDRGVNYHSRKVATFRKNYSLLETLSESSFAR